jgi:hypothetical protein
MLTTPIQYHRCFFVSLFSVLIIGCGRNVQSTLPDAPPPYPDSPFYESASNNAYIPPESPDPRNQIEPDVPSSSATTRSLNNYKSKTSLKNVYTLEATGTVWVLIQDKFGNELDWMSLIAGKKVPINFPGPLTITCSSGDSLKITDPNGKPFQVAGSRKGISIIRIP